MPAGSIKAVARTILTDTIESDLGTGWSIDETCGRPRRGEYVLLWARSGVGKSTLMLNLVWNQPLVPSVFVSLEMRPTTLAEWVVTMSGAYAPTPPAVVSHVLRSPDHPDHARFRAKLNDIAWPALWVAEVEYPSVGAIIEEVQQIEDRVQTKIERVFVDHVSLIEGAMDYTGTRQVSADLRRWARRDNILLVAAQQTGRAGIAFHNGNGRMVGNDGHLPVSLSSGLYAGEHDADWIFGAWRPELDPRWKQEPMPSALRYVTKLNVVKNRPWGTLLPQGISLMFDPVTRRLKEV